MNKRYFSLVELLTVIAVIAVLSGIAIPVIMRMSSKGKETKAAAEMNAIKLALNQFKSDYGIWPQIGPDASLIKNGDLFLETRYATGDSAPFSTAETAYDTLIECLTMTKPNGDVSTNTINTKKIRYLDPPAKPVIPLLGGSAGYYKLDPWGRRYNIALDWNYDNRISLTTTDGFARKSETKDILDKVLVYSYGDAEKDSAGNLDSEEFIYSWKNKAE